MSKKIQNLIKAIKTEVNALVKTKVSVYSKTYALELMFNEQSELDSEFAVNNPKFKDYIKKEIHNLDYLEYLKYKGFFSLGKVNVSYVLRFTDDALEHVRRKGVPNGNIISDFAERLSKLPKKGIIEYEHVVDVFYRARAPKKPGTTVNFRRQPPYTFEELNTLSKNDLIKLVQKFQRLLKKAEN